MIRIVIGMIFAMASLFLLIPTLRWLQTKQFKLFPVSPPRQIIYTGAKGLVHGVGSAVSGLCSAILSGLVLLNPTPDLTIITPLLILAVFSLLATELLSWFVSGTRSRQ